MSHQSATYLEGLLNRNTTVLNAIYQKFFPRIERAILTKGGNSEDAQDVFQEALLVIWRKANTAGFELTSSFYTYLYSVCTFIWLRKQKKKDNNTVTLEHVAGLKDVDDVVQHLEQSERNQLFKTHFLRMEEKCQRLLRLYFSGYPMKEISQKLDIENEHATRNRKYRCQKKLEDSILRDPRCLELIP